MKKTNTILFSAFILLIYYFTFSVNNCPAQWQQMSNGMGNLSVWSLAVNGNNIFAGTYPNTGNFGVYISTNYGTSWTQTSLNNVSVTSLAVNGNNVYTGTYPNTGVYLSTDNGASWTQTSLNNLSVMSLLVYGNTILAGTGGTNGVYLSTNNGTNWTQTSLNNRTVRSLAVSGNNIFAGTDTYGVYLSTDNGITWDQTSLSNQSVWSIAINGNRIFAGTHLPSNGVYLSTDNGTSWTQTSLNNQSVITLAVNGNNVLAGTFTNGVFVSADNGVSWTQRNEGLTGNITVYALSILNNYIYGGRYLQGVYRRPLGELITGVQPISTEAPNKFSLSQNYPNPFNPITKINFNIAKNGFVRLTVYDALGREVENLISQQMNAGSYSMDFNGSKIVSGIYFYRLQSAEFTDVKKLVLLK